MKILRKVAIYDYEKVVGETYYGKKLVGHGLFHQFGVDYEEFDAGAGNFSTAIVEMPSGEIKNVPVELIVFNT